MVARKQKQREEEAGNLLILQGQPKWVPPAGLRFFKVPPRPKPFAAGPYLSSSTGLWYSLLSGT